MSIHYQKSNCRKIIFVTTIFGGLIVLMPSIDVELPPIPLIHFTMFKTPSLFVTSIVLVIIFEVSLYVDVVVNPKPNATTNLKPIQPKK